jgi:ankyrin repeat protein
MMRLIQTSVSVYLCLPCGWAVYSGCIDRKGFVVSSPRLLIQAGADKDKAITNGATPLYIASEKVHLDIVRLLIEAGADKDNTRDTDGVSPMFMASQNGHLEVVRLLVEAGADKDKADEDGQTPLYIARWLRHDGIVEMLPRAGATG